MLYLKLFVAQFPVAGPFGHTKKINIISEQLSLNDNLKWPFYLFWKNISLN